MSKKIRMEITDTNEQRNALDVDRWGVHERGYLWAEVDSPDHVHLSLFPLTNLVRVDLDLPREMIQKQPEDLSLLDNRQSCITFVTGLICEKIHFS